MLADCFWHLDIRIIAMDEKIFVEEVNRVPLVAIVGRPNVGKSSLFNAIAGKRISIVHEQSGVTRDRLVAPVSCDGRHFQLVDTGGLGTFTGERKNLNIWDKGIREQVETAIEGADVLIFVCNVQDGIAPLDREVAYRLHGIGKKVFLAINKCDNEQLESEVLAFAELGFPKVFPVSCLHRRGIGALLDKALADIPVRRQLAEQPEPVRIAVVGRPNVGKSSLVNWMLGEDRVMVSEIAGTTRDAIDIDFSLRYKGEDIPAMLIDTAGLRKKAKVKDALEMFSMMRTNEAIARAQLVLFLVEACAEGVTAQDRKIAAMIVESGKGCIIVANKFDLLEAGDAKKQQLLEEIRYTLPHLSYAPVVFTSTVTRDNMDALLDQIAEVMAQMDVKVPTSMVNKVLMDAFARNSAPVIGISPLKLFYAAMAGTQPPRFIIFVNKTEFCADNYLAYLNRVLRQTFDFTGWPIIVELRARPKKVQSIRTVPIRVKKTAERASVPGRKTFDKNKTRPKKKVKNPKKAK
jgi:GTP-binding protein